MITIDSATIKNLQPSRKTEATSKKNSKKVSFSHLSHTSDSHELEAVNPLSLINPFLFLQEVDEYTEEQQKLKESGNKILSSLNDLRFGLIKGEIKEHQIHNLKSILEANRFKFKFTELQNVIDDIVLRCEVELAKIEASSKI